MRKVTVKDFEHLRDEASRMTRGVDVLALMAPDLLRMYEEDKAKAKAEAEAEAEAMEKNSGAGQLPEERPTLSIPMGEKSARRVQTVSGETSNQKRNKKKKKKKKVNHGPEPPPGLPAPFKNRILELGGSEVKLVIQKVLYQTDISQGHNRFSVPVSQVRQQFLREEERRMLETHDGNVIASMEVRIIEPNLRESKIRLKKWSMPKKSGNGSSLYVLNETWNEVKKRNNLQEGMVLQLWSFRVRDELRFAVVQLPGIGEENDD